MTLGMTFLRYNIYRVQMSGVRVAQKLLNSFFEFIQILWLVYILLKWTHIFSMGLKSGDSGGVAHQFTPCSLKKSCIWPLDCFGSLSCCSRWPSGKRFLRNGSKPASYTVAKHSAFIVPVKITTLVAPLFDMPPQMCTFTRCLARCLRSRGIRRLRKHSLLCCSSWTVDSSVKSTSSNFSLALNCSLHQINLFFLFNFKTKKK